MKTLYIHYLASTPVGPIRTVRHEIKQERQTAVICEGGRYSVACQPSRPFLSQTTEKRFAKFGPDFLATGDWRVVSCPQCLKSAYYLRDAVVPTSEESEVA